jgi:hypothetical protein
MIGLLVGIVIMLLIVVGLILAIVLKSDGVEEPTPAPVESAE